MKSQYTMMEFLRRFTVGLYLGTAPGDFVLVVGETSILLGILLAYKRSPNTLASGMQNGVLEARYSF